MGGQGRQGVCGAAGAGAEGEEGDVAWEEGGTVGFSVLGEEGRGVNTYYAHIGVLQEDGVVGLFGLDLFSYTAREWVRDLNACERDSRASCEEATREAARNMARLLCSSRESRILIHLQSENLCICDI